MNDKKRIKKVFVFIFTLFSIQILINFFKLFQFLLIFLFNSQLSLINFLNHISHRKLCYSKTVK